MFQVEGTQSTNTYKHYMSTLGPGHKETNFFHVRGALFFNKPMYLSSHNSLGVLAGSYNSKTSCHCHCAHQGHPLILLFHTATSTLPGHFQDCEQAESAQIDSTGKPGTMIFLVPCEQVCVCMNVHVSIKRKNYFMIYLIFYYYYSFIRILITRLIENSEHGF